MSGVQSSEFGWRDWQLDGQIPAARLPDQPAWCSVDRYLGRLTRAPCYDYRAERLGIDGALLRASAYGTKRRDEYRFEDA